MTCWLAGFTLAMVGKQRMMARWNVEADKLLGHDREA